MTNCLSKNIRALMSLMSLSGNQNETAKEDIVKTVVSSILSSEQRVKELESSNILEKIKTNEENQNQNYINQNIPRDIDLTNVSINHQEIYLNEERTIGNNQGNTSLTIEKLKQENPAIIDELRAYPKIIFL